MFCFIFNNKIGTEIIYWVYVDAKKSYFMLPHIKALKIKALFSFELR